MKRSEKVGAYKGKWNTVTGYLDELKTICEKALEELQEELGLSRKDILQIKLGTSYEFFDPRVKKTWLVHPVLVELKQKPDIKLDWENTEYKWIYPKDLLRFDIVPLLEESLRRVID